MPSYIPLKLCIFSFFVTGLYLGISGGVDGLNYKRYTNYPKVEGQIVESFANQTVHQMPSGKSYTYDNYIEYTFKHNGHAYTSNSYSNVSVSRYNIEQFSKGAIVDVYCNPRNPKKSFLIVKRDTGKQMKFYFGLAILAIAMLMYFIFLPKK